MTDEDDCSHALGTNTFAEDAIGSCGINEFTPERDDARRCYAANADLTPPAQYAQRLRGLVDDGAIHDVSVGVIAGVSDGTNRSIGEACVLDDAGERNTTCRPAFGQSINPSECPADAAPACCTADPSFRYAGFAQQFDENSVVTSSICRPDLTRPMLAIVAQLPPVGAAP